MEVERRRAAVPRPRRGRAVSAYGGLTLEGVEPAVFAAFAGYDTEALAVLAERNGSLVVRWVNRACAELLGYAEQELAGLPFANLQHSPFAPGSGADAVECAGLVDAVRTTRRSIVLERRDGTKLQLEATGVPVGEPQDAGWVLRLTATTEVHEVAEELQASYERFQALADQAPIGIFSSDGGLRLGYVNDRYCAMHGLSEAQLLGTQWMSHLHPDDLEPALAALGRVLMGESVELPLRLARTDGQQREVHARVVPVRSSGRDAGFLGTLEDVTDRLAWERQLAHRALHDPLTGLPNRRQLLEQVAVHLANGEEALAVLFLDLDDFKLVNDSLGHDAGDRLLVEVGERLKGAVREGDLVARFGGDEFAVLCRAVSNEQEAAPVAHRLLEALRRPVLLDGRECAIGGSVGVVLSTGPTAAGSAEGLLRDADVAMYQAKNSGKGSWALFDEKAREQAQDRLALVTDLRRALAAGEVTVAYQPIVSVGEPGDPLGAMTGVEALARWMHPIRGAVPPQVFVELAEQNGLVVTLGRHVLETACRQLVAWSGASGAAPPGSVSVNVSPIQLRQPDFAEVVAGVLAETGLPGNRLCLELTETVVMLDPDAAVRTFQALRRLGVRIALDDFGTGYSSLALLRNLPVDQLKIDRSFLSGYHGPGADPVFATIVSLAASLGLLAVAEGVETPEQLEQLRRLGCPLAQGYLFGRPVPAGELVRPRLEVVS
ncbi:MAG: hypothetical protein JWN57_470 [Frankiales bacterium]|nr:hypothetical protein [Frankiales bacterium]